MMYKVGYVPGDLNDCTSLDLNYMKFECVLCGAWFEYFVNQRECDVLIKYACDVVVSYF